MSTQEQARALMMRHHHLVKNRQQSLLNRAAVEMGVDTASTSTRFKVSSIPPSASFMTAVQLR